MAIIWYPPLATISGPGLMPALDGSATRFLSGLGTWLAVQGIPRFTTTGINLKNTGQTKVAALGANFVPMHAVVTPTAVSGFVTAATVSVGTVGGSYLDVCPVQALTGLNAVSKAFQLVLAVPGGQVGSDLYMDVTIGAVGTTFTAQVDVIGYYV